jgi:hypothetical protein
VGDGEWLLELVEDLRHFGYVVLEVPDGSDEQPGEPGGSYLGFEFGDFERHGEELPMGKGWSGWEVPHLSKGRIVLATGDESMCCIADGCVGMGEVDVADHSDRFAR